MTERASAAEARAGASEAQPPGGIRVSQLSSFIGRQRELAELEALFETGRLVTISGPGGSGKTRLVLQLAERVRHRLADGVCFVDLASLRDPALVPSTIASVLAIREAPGQAVLDTLAERLAAKRVLLVLDNLEQLLPAAATLVGVLLSRCPNVHVLATSRAPLHLRGEHEYPLDPLRLPDEAELQSLERLERTEAIALFLERARAVNPRLRLTTDNAAAIAAICARLDGLPLALELAAARTKVLGPEALLQRLKASLRLLTSGAADAPARQHTLRDTIAWSYNLLPGAERRIFARLSVFVGGCTLEAAEVVVPDPADLDSEPDLLDALGRIVDQGLLRVSADIDRQPRFTMLETIREFATDQLAEGADHVRGRHAQVFVDLAVQAEPALDGPQQAEWIARLEQEHDNLRATITWLRDTGNIEQELRLVGSLASFWNIRGHVHEGSRWIEDALGRAGGDPTIDRAEALRGAASLAGHAGRYRESIAFAEQSVELWRQLNDRLGLARSLRVLANSVKETGDLQPARDLYERAASVADETGDIVAKIDSVGDLGYLALIEHDWNEAARLSHEALIAWRELGDDLGSANESCNLGHALVHLGRPNEALAHYRESIDRARVLGSTELVADALVGVSTVAAVAGEWPIGARLLGAHDGLRERAGVPPASFERDLRARTQATLQARLGASLDEHYQAGRELSEMEALQEALALIVPSTSPRAGNTQKMPRDRHGLTARELEVLALVATGRSDGEIADRLFISKKTASVHVANIKGKLGANSRVETVTIAQRLGLVEFA